MRSAVGLAIGSIMLGLVAACATAPVESQVVRVKPAAEVGDTVYLYHGGNKLARQTYYNNAVIPVYRYDGRYSSFAGTPIVRHEIGKIKITSGREYYVEGVVVQGSIRNGDVAVSPGSGSIVNVQ